MTYDGRSISNANMEIGCNKYIDLKARQLLKRRAVGGRRLTGSGFGGPVTRTGYSPA